MLFLSPAQAQDKGRDVIADEKGIASFYSWRHQGRRMANGKRFNSLGATAASRTLPLGAFGTHLECGLEASGRVLPI